MESDETYTNLYDKDEKVMQECQDEAMGDWEGMPSTLQKTRKKKEFTDETAKKYWKMKAAEFVREKRASVLHNNREAKISRRIDGPTVKACARPRGRNRRR
jgi:hypothetical protein